ncbi:hypothetical protein [Sphaerisporangium siamense]|uniref:Lipoprotein n=1 Tax=Sphaerisporangium siamense TaxID=795645 RepID=A0A7W7D9N7_9ACTN|nr:hypothetical protein [Sphaerisporangium siamense]MBB4702839.1 hypothetical protein [Sphaerisporangium siamense]
MLILSSPVKLRRKGAVIALLVPLALTACTSDEGPTAAQAGQTLKNHILQLLKERNAQNVTITEPGGRNIPCADGRAKQIFAATGTDVAKTTTPDNVRSALLGALNRVAPYNVVDAGPLSAPIHVQNDATKTKLLLDSPAVGVYAVSGETDCLASQ